MTPCSTELTAPSMRPCEKRVDEAPMSPTLNTRRKTVLPLSSGTFEKATPTKVEITENRTLNVTDMREEKKPSSIIGRRHINTAKRTWRTRPAQRNGAPIVLPKDCGESAKPITSTTRNIRTYEYVTTARCSRTSTASYFVNSASRRSLV